MTNTTSRGGAQLFCLVVGATLIAAGILGFFYESAFTSDEAVREPVLGLLDVNGWHNVVHLATGGLSIAFGLSSEPAARTWALIFGVVYLVVAAWGFAIGSGDSILSIIPINTEDSVLHLLFGIGGVATYALTNPEPRGRTVSAAT